MDILSRAVLSKARAVSARSEPFMQAQSRLGKVHAVSARPAPFREGGGIWEEASGSGHLGGGMWEEASGRRQQQQQPQQQSLTISNPSGRTGSMTDCGCPARAGSRQDLRPRSLSEDKNVLICQPGPLPLGPSLRQIAFCGCPARAGNNQFLRLNVSSDTTYLYRMPSLCPQLCFPASKCFLWLPGPGWEPSSPQAKRLKQTQECIHMSTWASPRGAVTPSESLLWLPGPGWKQSGS